MCSILTRYSPSGSVFGTVNLNCVEVVSKVMAEVVMLAGPSSQTLNHTEPLPSNAAAVLGAFAM